jgi:hypothetical protein
VFDLLIGDIDQLRFLNGGGRLRLTTNNDSDHRDEGENENQHGNEHLDQCEALF